MAPRRRREMIVKPRPATISELPTTVSPMVLLPVWGRVATASSTFTSGCVVVGAAVVGVVAGVGVDREGGGGGDTLEEELHVAGVGNDGAGVVVGVEPETVGVVVAARPEDQTGYEEREGE